jgi:hypothetical protein
VTRGRVRRCNCCWPSLTNHSRVRVPGNSLSLETPPTWRARFPYLYPPGKGRPGYTPRHWVPFSSPSATRRATMEILEPASTLAWTSANSKSKSELLYGWRFTANQFILASSPLRLTTRDFFPTTEPLRY